MTTEPSQPPTDRNDKVIRVTPRVHARLERIVQDTSCRTLGDAVSLLLDPTVVRTAVSREQRMRWEAEAERCGMSLPDFVVAQVEASIVFGADLGAIRHIRSMVHSLTVAAGIAPEQVPVRRKHQPPADS